MSRLARQLVVLGALATVALFTAACTGDDGAAPATLAGTAAAVASPTEGATAAIVTATPSSTATQPPRTITSPAIAADNGVWLIDAPRGERTVLAEFSLRSFGFSSPPTFAADGRSIWTDSPGGDAIRYSLAGDELERIDRARRVVESANGQGRFYSRIGADGSYQGRVFESAAGIAEVEQGSRPEFSPDGARVAFTQWQADTQTSTLRVLDLASGEIVTLASGLEGCECGGGPGIAWSPTGRYLAYSDFGAGDPSTPTGEPAETPIDRGVHIIELATAQSTKITPEPWGRAGSWHPERDLIAVERDNALYFVDLETGEERLVVAGTDSTNYWLDPGWRQVQSVISSGPPYVYQSVIFDPADGRELARWDGNGTPVWTESGPAFAARTSGSAVDLDCAGLLVDHPSLIESRCFEGAELASWSPDGRFLLLTRARHTQILRAAAYVTIRGWELVLFDTLTDTERVLSGDLLPDQYPQIQWNRDGTHALVVWPYGP